MMIDANDFKNFEIGTKSTGCKYLSAMFKSKKAAAKYQDSTNNYYAAQMELCFNPEYGDIEFFNIMLLDTDGDVIKEIEFDWENEDVKAFIEAANAKEMLVSDIEFQTIMQHLLEDTSSITRDDISDGTFKKLVAMVGEPIIQIAYSWEQLSVEDLLELKEKNATRVHCVYNNWKDLVSAVIENDSINKEAPEYLIKCVDLDKLAAYWKETNNGGMYTELKSGKVVDFDTI